MYCVFNECSLLLEFFHAGTVTIVCLPEVCSVPEEHPDLCAHRAPSARLVTSRCVWGLFRGLSALVSAQMMNVSSQS